MRFILSPEYHQQMLRVRDHSADCYVRPGEYLHHLYVEGVKYVIVPAVEACQYQAIRADQISEPGMITSQVIQHIVDDPPVVADLSGRNPNVFYELAIRHILRKPLVQLRACHQITRTL